MAVSHTILQAKGNQSRSAMSLLKMDGETSFPIGTVVSLTVITELADGTDVDASAAITLTTVAALDTVGLVEAFVAKLNTTLDGAQARWEQNTPNEFVVHVECEAGAAWYVGLSTATFDNTPE